MNQKLKIQPLKINNKLMKYVYYIKINYNHRNYKQKMN